MILNECNFVYWLCLEYLQKKVDDVDHKIAKNKEQNKKKPNADIERPKEVQDK